MGLAAAAIGAAGSVLGGIIGAKGASDTNAASIAFQRELAQNKYQWAVKDMEAAGLNPKLAGTQAGSIASTGSAPALKNPGESISQGLMAASNIAANAVQTMSSATKNMADAKLADEQAKTQREQRFLYNRHSMLALAQELEARARTAKTDEERKYYAAMTGRTVEEVQRLMNENSWYRDVRRPYQDTLRDMPILGFVDQFASAAKSYGLTLDTILNLLPIGKLNKLGRGKTDAKLSGSAGRLNSGTSSNPKFNKPSGMSWNEFFLNGK